MARRVIIFGSINIYPSAKPDPDNPGEMIEGKDLVISDPDSGTDYVYPMSKGLAEETGRDLKMNNKALISKIQDAQQRQAARELLAGGNGSITPEDILRGVPRKDDE